MKKFRVVDLRGDAILPNEEVANADSPEAAVRLVLGVDAVRGSTKRFPPVARVYWSDSNGQTNMVRLYTRLGSTQA